MQFVQEENPDLALFMEVDERWIEQLDALSAELPYFSGEGNSNNFGIVMYSRYPLTTTELVNFAADSTPSLTTTMTLQGRSLAVVGTHPLPPVRPSYFHSRNRQLDQLGQYLQGIEQPTIVIGDFNITMWSPYYQRFQRQTGLKNVRNGFGLLPSWPTGKLYGPLPKWLMPLLAIPIDHGFISPELAVTNVQVGPNVGSDHRPVVIDLRL
ncbi:MAG: endonuclease/exonuclease/phosphatase family protein [Leptolyngbya sp. SIOISBB]|nr:endonuclease/exonuclease/phosphatase family protein [Leptolyngbya sp. SIOISBB]